MYRLLRRLRARWGPAFQSDTAFIEAAFREILGRNADLDGLRHYRSVLRAGLGRTAVLLDIMRSEEFRAKLVPAAPSLPDLRPQRPDRYRQTIDRSNGQTITIFDAASPSDLDWLEAKILENRYYEKPGVWVLGVDADKRLMAEIVAAFAPERALELGCAAGAVLDCLTDLGVAAEGVEISAMAIERAPVSVKRSIHHGDLLSLSLPAQYDMVFGLDVFEHLNPNRLGAYVARLREITRDEGFLFCNIPAFGEDAVFGTVFPLYIGGWELDAAAGRTFSSIHVDELGYPIHGHLAWADARWWTERFEAEGFHRQPGIERTLHAKYDAHMERRAPARRAFFVFSGTAVPARRQEIIRRITSSPSLVLGAGHR
jgi:2-polyprenyl-3-methyl-5-hydroxy-6-metoxy-1,4-benzoquinol methylase